MATWNEIPVLCYVKIHNYGVLAKKDTDYASVKEISSYMKSKSCESRMPANHSLQSPSNPPLTQMLS